MDALERQILQELQQEGRLSVTELAQRVRASVSATHRRLRDLERSRVIVGYRAQIDATAVGLDFEALVFVSMAEGGRAQLDRFERGVAEIKEVVQAQRLFGTPDYLLRVVTTDLAAFRALYDEQLTDLPGVQRLTTTLVMATVVEERPLPL